MYSAMQLNKNTSSENKLKSYKLLVQHNIQLTILNEVKTTQLRYLMM